MQKGLWILFITILMSMQGIDEGMVDTIFNHEVFTIQDLPIQDTYATQVEMKAFVEDDPIQTQLEVRMYQKEEYEAINNLEWTKVEGGYVGCWIVKDVVQGHVEIWEKDGEQAIAISKPFSVDSQAPTFVLEVDNVFVKTLPSYVKKGTQIDFHWDDPNLLLSSTKLTLTKDHEVIFEECEKADISFTMEEEGTYTIQAISEDIYGHKQTFVNEGKTFLCDGQPPLVQLKDGTQSLENKIVYYEDKELRLEVEEENFDTEHSYIVRNKHKVETTWKKDNNRWYTSLTFLEHGETTIGYNLQDLAGNTTNKSDAYLVDIDKQAPLVNVKLNEKTIHHAFSSFYKENQKLYITIEEEHLNKEQSHVLLNHEELPFVYDQKRKCYVIEKTLSDGDYLLEWVLLDQGNHQNKRTFESFCIDTIPPSITLQHNRKQEFMKEDVTYTFEIEDKNIHQQDIVIWYEKDGIKQGMDMVWEKENTIWKSRYTWSQEGNYQIYMQIQDEAGNQAIYKDVKAQEELRFTIDKTAPVLFISRKYANFYNKEQEIQWYVKDKHMQVEDVEIKIVKDKVSFQNNEIRRKDGLAYLSFQQDGDYMLSFKGYDKAGNPLQYQIDEQPNKKGILQFVIDTISPTIKIQNNITKMNAKDVYFDYQIDDYNLSNYEISVKRNQKQMSKAWMKGTKNIQNRQILHEEEGSCGVYELSVKAIDKVGNITYSNVFTFVIDKKKPVVEVNVNHVQLQENKTYVTNQKAKLTVQYTDDFLRSATVILKKNGLVEKKWLNQKGIKYELPNKEGEEDRYELITTIKDEAGNYIRQRTAIVLDQKIDLPEIDNDVFHGLAYAHPWIPRLKKGSEPYHVMQVTLLRNQKLIPYHWGDVIQDDGAYAMHVVIRDDANNQACLLKPFYFTIDRTPPQIQLQYKDNKQDITSSKIMKKDLLLTLKKEPFDTSAHFTNIYVQGKKQERKDYQTTQFIIPVKEEKLTITCEAKDDAGNVSQKQWNLNVVMKQDKTELEMAEIKPLQIVCGGLVFLLLGIGFYGYRRRNN